MRGIVGIVGLIVLAILYSAVGGCINMVGHFVK